MTRAQLEYRIKELKMDYSRIQGDIEKLESTGHGVEKAEQMLAAIEAELAQLNDQLHALDQQEPADSVWRDFAK